MLCQKCQNRAANCHLTSVINGVMTSRDFCRECMEADSPHLSGMQEKTCEYCGERPCTGSGDFLATLRGVPKMRWMCLPCSAEQGRFVQEQLQRTDWIASEPARLAFLANLEKEVHHYMQLWSAVNRPSQE